MITAQAKVLWDLPVKTTDVGPQLGCQIILEFICTTSAVVDNNSVSSSVWHKTSFCIFCTPTKWYCNRRVTIQDMLSQQLVSEFLTCEMEALPPSTIAQRRGQCCRTKNFFYAIFFLYVSLLGLLILQKVLTHLITEVG